MAKPATLRKVGNSASVSIPRDIVTKLGWRLSDVLYLSVRGDALLVQRMRPPEPLVSVPEERTTRGNL